jgi:uncharacterized membrane protein
VAAAFVLATALAAVPNAGPAVDVLRLLHSGVDYHKDTSHSFFLAGAQSVMCARNSGIYAGALLFVVWAWVSGLGRAQGFPPLRVGLALALFVGVMAADGFNSLAAELGYPTPYAPATALRLGTGLLAGVAVAAYFLPVLNGLLWRASDERPVLPGYRSLPLALLMPSALWLGVVLRVDALALPVALLTTVATLGLFGGVNLLFLILVLRKDRQFGRAGELLRPGAAALALASAQLALLAWVVRAVVSKA